MFLARRYAARSAEHCSASCFPLWGKSPVRTLGNRGRPAVPEKTLDSKSRKDYTKYTKSGGAQSAKLVAPAQKLNQARMNDPRETVTHRAEGEGKNSQAKGSDQDGTSESAIARSDREAHQRGNRHTKAGISQVTTEAERREESFCPFLRPFWGKAPPLPASPQAARPPPPEGEASANSKNQKLNQYGGTT